VPFKQTLIGPPETGESDGLVATVIILSNPIGIGFGHSLSAIFGWRGGLEAFKRPVGRAFMRSIRLGMQISGVSILMVSTSWSHLQNA